MATEGSVSPRSSTRAGAQSGAGRSGGAGPGAMDAIKPLLAGAQARGMADALDLAGIPAVLIDRQGMVLHAGPSARSLFCQDFSLHADHLVSSSADSTRAIQDLIGQALEPGPEPDPVRLVRREGGALVLRAKRVNGSADDVFQLLKVLILIDIQSVCSSAN